MEDTSHYFDSENNGGSIQGIIHSERVKIDNWFTKRGLQSHEYEKYINIPVAFLNNINTHDEERGNGYGFELYEEFEDFCKINNCKSIFLESDILEEQQNGFILDGWYKKLGFEIIDNKYGNSIMFKNLSE